MIKAELQMLARRGQLQEAELGLLNARLDLAVVLFPESRCRTINFCPDRTSQLRAPQHPVNRQSQNALWQRRPQIQFPNSRIWNVPDAFDGTRSWCVLASSAIVLEPACVAIRCTAVYLSGESS